MSLHATGVPQTSVILAQSAVAVSVTGTTSKTKLATVSIPAGAMKANSALRITCVVSCTNNANVKTLSVEIGAWAANPPMASFASAQVQQILRNRGAVNSQVAYNSFNPSSTGAVVTSSVDFSAAQTLTISGTLATGTDTFTLEAYTVEILG